MYTNKLIHQWKAIKKNAKYLKKKKKKSITAITAAKFLHDFIMEICYFVLK